MLSAVNQCRGQRPSRLSLSDPGTRRATEAAYPIMLDAQLGQETARGGLDRSAGWDNRGAEGKVERALTSEQRGPWMEPHTCIHWMPLLERRLEGIT